jgi:Flp pilus assembly protein TadG
MNRFLRDRRAASNYVEAIFTFPIVVVLVIAIINGGMVMFGQSVVEDAARQGARMGSVAQSGGAALAYQNAYSIASKIHYFKNLKVEILAPGGVAGTLITIRVSADVPNYFGSLVPFVQKSFHVSSYTTFRQEGW